MKNKKLQKRLIVNADDFGLDSAINHGIIESFRKGIVTNSSLLVCGRAFDEAVELAKKYTDLGIGIHLAINEEKSILPRDKIKTLLSGNENSFFNYLAFLRRFLSGKVVLRHIYVEFKAQIEKFIATGLKPTHLDSHKHIHLIPTIFEILLGLAKEFGIARIRVSRNSLIHILGSRKYFRAAEVLGLSVLANIQLRKMTKHMVNTSRYCYGLIESGCLNEKRLTKILNCLPIGTNELICHPGFTTDELLSRYKWNYDWRTELRTLTNPSIKTLVNNLNIQLIKYDEI